MGWLYLATEYLYFPFLLMLSVAKCWIGMFLNLRAVSVFSFSSHLCLSLPLITWCCFSWQDYPFHYDCLPPKPSQLPPYLWEFIKVSSSKCSLPFFSTFSPSQITSFPVFATLFQLSPQPSHPFVITSYFLFHFLSQKMFLDPFPKNFGMKSRTFYVSIWVHFQRCFISLDPLTFTPTEVWICQCLPASIEVI